MKRQRNTSWQKAVLLSGLLGLVGGAQAAQVQWAEIKSVGGSGSVLSFSLNYIDFIVLDSPAAEARAMKLGGFKTREALYEKFPAGTYIRDLNPKLRTLKTDARTVYTLVCEGKVGRQEFLAAYRMGPELRPKCEIPFSPPIVRLELDGLKIKKISQQFLP